MNPYAVLGLSDGASADECKAAFRKLAKTCHPDLHPNDVAAEARFKEINAAYDAITNPQPQPQPQAHTNWSFNFGGASPFDDLFAHLRGGARHDLTYHVSLTLEEAFSGKEIALQVQSPDGTAARDLKIRVPPGVEDGTRLVVPNAGHQPHPSVRAGDLFIIIRLAPHQRFSRQGANLLTMAPVTAFDVLLGNEIEVVGIDGHTIRVAIPANFDSSRKLRLAGQGMPFGQGGRGDLLVELFIQFPVVPQHQHAALRVIAESTKS